MKELRCSACGANQLIDRGIHYVCAFCGTEFLKESAGVSSLDREHRIDEMLKRADMYWRHNNKPQARNLYRQILELDGGCKIAKLRT